MNICIVGPSFGYGGANMVASRIGKELSRYHNVYYYSFRFEGNYLEIPEESLFFYKKKRNGVIEKAKKVWELLRNSGEFTPDKYVKAEISYLSNLISEKKIDFIILNSFNSATLFAKALKERFPDIPVVSWMHESVEHSFNILTKRYPKAFIEGIRCSDTIVCLTKQDYEKFTQYNDNVEIIYNPVSFENEEISDLTTKTISFVTRLDIKTKGLDVLAKVANRLPKNWSIELAANSRDNQLQLFQKLLSKENTENNIHFVGPKKGQELINHYLNSSIFISTSRFEALPLVFLEAMSCGLPIVSFDHSGAKEILDNGKYGILVPRMDDEKMALEIERLIKDTSLRQEYQQLSLERAEDFRLDKILNQWLTLIENRGEKNGIHLKKTE